MAEFTKRRNNADDFKERFEFKLTVGDNIICQRYFRIGGFNPASLYSIELMETIEQCAQMINRDLKDKTQVYLSHMAPMVFNTEEEMLKYFENEDNCNRMHLGEGIVVKNKTHNYAWNGSRPTVLKESFDKGEYSQPLTDADWQTYKFAFYDNGREVCSTVWEGCYPKAVRNSIDLSNKNNRFDKDSSFESYTLSKMVEGKSDIIYPIIKAICLTCSIPSSEKWHTTTLEYKNEDGSVTTYDNLKYAREEVLTEMKGRPYGTNRR